MKALPVVSLRDVVVSLLEENRFEEGIRFLITVGSPALLHDSRLITSLLGIFKSTSMIEDDLRKRSAYLLNRMNMKDGNDSVVWKVDNDRRRRLIQSQQGVVEYLSSVKTQFLRPWFDENFAAEPEGFWKFLDELTTRPESSSDETTGHLEIEMYVNRLSISCLLLERMNSDLAANTSRVFGSVFMRIASEGFVRTSRLPYPKLLLDQLKHYFGAITGNLCPREERRVMMLLLDLLVAATACDAISRDDCVQAIAKFLIDQRFDARADFISLIYSDTFAVEVIDYMLVTWYSFNIEGKKGARASLTQALSKPPGISKTAFCLHNARPTPGKLTSDDWHDLVSLLAMLVQRSMRAFSSRLCKVNNPPNSAASVDTMHPTVAMVVNESPDLKELRDACQVLRQTIAALHPRPDPVNDMKDSDNDMDSISDLNDSTSSGGYSSSDRLKMLYAELDLLDSLVCHTQG
ncbi:hypothetical protein H4R20_003149 [Coemansia guatemalensis]|uniref:Uncharacterized protein n=1 Tax=Coemansia guatemalensis TaxID=2761395 RepID=A0A9W8HTV4_9FUNG|nr:hypothetical protein H4R20_003149 [Coemansia guatemalensis]